MYGSEYFPIIYYSNFIQMIHSTKVFGLYSRYKNDDSLQACKRETTVLSNYNVFLL